MRDNNRTLAAVLLSVAVLGTFGLFPLAQSRASESNNDAKSQQIVSNRLSAPAALQLATQNVPSSGTSSVVDPLQDAIAAQLAAKGVRYRTLDKTQKNETYVEVVVQLKESPAANIGSLPENGASTAEIQAATERVIAAQSSIKKAAERITHQAATTSYGYVVNGFTTKVKVKDIAKLQQLAGVKSVTVAKVYYSAESSANDMANVSSVWSNYKYKGEGTVVSIIDTGIDPNHKDLRLSHNSSAKLTPEDVNTFTQSAGYGKYFTAKVPYGHNYSDNNEIIIDDDPAEQHGMHVAGIVGANGTGKNPTTSVVGVAPEAQLLAMKAFSNSDTSATTDSTTVIAAIDDSAKLGADVLNMSLGSSAGRQTLDDPEIAAVENAVAKGTASVISAGNSGTSAGGEASTNKDYYGNSDNSMVGSPGTARGATTVASAENTKAINTAITITDGTTTILGPSSTQISEGIDTATFNNRQVVALKNADGKLSFGLPEDYAGQDVAGKIVVVSRGSIAFTAKQANAQAAGAAGVLIVNNAGGDIALTSVAYDPGFPAAGLSTNDGQKLVAYLDANPNKTLSVTIGLAQLENQVQKVDRMSEFTSYGPVSDLSFKPDITAPGGNIWSLQNKNGYTNLSGTSMASPFVAGTQALLKQSINNPKNTFYAYYQTLSGSEISALFKTIEMNTADIIPDISRDGVPVSPRRQGAGMVNVEAAIRAIETNPSTVTGENGYPGIELKSIDRRTHAFKLKFTNRTANDLTYTLDQPEKLTGIYTSAIDPSTAIVYDKAINGASIHPNETIDVPAGQTREIAFTLNLPNDFEENQYVEGFLSFTASDNSKLRIPYMGYFGNWGEPEIFDKLNGQAFDPANNNYGTIVAGLNADGDIITIPGFETDANGGYFVSENKIAFSMDSDASVRAIQPQYYLFRNAVNVSTQILDDKGNVITQSSNNYSLTKTYWNANAQQYTRYTNAPSWDGTYINQSSGKTVSVKDGSYRYRIKGTVDGTNQTQSYDIPVKVDSVKPSVRNLKLTRGRDQEGKTVYFLTAEAKDDFSGIGNTANFSVNDVIQSDAEYEQIGTTADGYAQLKFALSEDQAKALQAGRNDLSIAVFDNASNAATTSSNAQKPGETNFGLVLRGSGIPDVITTETAGYKALDVGGTFTFTGSYPLEPVFTYTKSDGTETSGSLSYNQGTQTFTADLPFETVDYTTTVRFYTDDSKDTLIYEKQVRISTVPPVIQTISVDDTLTFDAETVSEATEASTSESAVTLTGKVSTDTKSLVITNSADPHTKVEASINEDGGYTADVPVQGGSNTLKLTAIDGDGNTQALSQIVTSSNYGEVVQSNEDVAFDDDVRFGFVYVNATTKNYDPATGVISISGRVARPTTTLTIDGQPITIEADQTFKTTLKIGLQGSKPFSVLIGDSSTNDFVQERITFYVDGQAPNLTLDAAKDADGDGKTDVIYTDKPVFNLAGRVTDNLPYYTLSINGNVLKENLPEIDMNTTASLNEKFSYPQQLKAGENHFSVTVADYLSNSTTKDITVIYTPRDQAAIDAAKSSLQAKYDKSTKLSQSDRYTPESQQNLATAREQAATILNDEDASASDYQAAEKILDQAISAMVEKETTEQPSTDSKEDALTKIASVRNALDQKVGESKNSEDGLTVYETLAQITADLNAGTITPEEALIRLNRVLDDTLKSQAQSIKNGTAEEIGQKINQASGRSYFVDVDTAVATGLAASDSEGKIAQIRELQTLRNLIQKVTEEAQKPVDPDEGSKPVDPDEGTKPVDPDEGTKPIDPDKGTKPVDPNKVNKPSESVDDNKAASSSTKNDAQKNSLPKTQIDATRKAKVVGEFTNQSSAANGQATNSNQRLPQTGESDGNAFTIAGLAVVSLLGFGIVSRRKRIS